MIKAIVLLLALASRAFAAAPPYYGVVPSTSGGTAAMYLSGTDCVAASSTTAGTCAVSISGPAASVTATTFVGPQLTSLAASSTTAAANIATLFTNINSTGAALTTETARATAAEAVLSASTATLALVKASTGTCALPNLALVLGSGAVTCAQPSNITGQAATVPAAGVNAGSLGASVMASSIAASGVAAGTYGDGTHVSQIAVGIDGRITSASNVAVGTIGVPAGGTGDTSLTAHGVVIGEGTSNLNSIPAMGNGGIVIGAGTGADPSTGTITGNAAVTVTNAAGSITLSLANSSATLQGNTFNGASQLVQMGSDSKLPAIDGSKLTNIGGTLSGGINTMHAVWTGATTISNSSFVSEVSSGVFISTNLYMSGTSAHSNVGNLGNSGSAGTGFGHAGTGFQVCDATATAITTHGSPVFIAIMGDATSNTSAEGLKLFVLQDGAFINGESVSVPVLQMITTTGDKSYPLAAPFFVNPTPTSGSHTYCFGVSAIGNTGTSYLGRVGPVQFGVVEFR